MKKKITSFPESVPQSGELLQLLSKANRPLSLDDILRHSGVKRRLKREVQTILLAMAESGDILRLPGGSYAPSSIVKTVSGRFLAVRSGAGFVTPDSAAKISGDIYIHHDMSGGAEHGDLVRVAVFPGKRGKNVEGRVLEVVERPLKRIIAEMGSENTVAAQEALVKMTRNAPGPFEPRVLAEAAALPQNPRPEDWQGREDLRDIPFVTIDGADARDFDDAIFVREEGSGFTLYVAIADVSHYVAERSALDKEAFGRGNSWYFPRSVEPMLPEALSNGLCSLKPGVPRLAMAAEIKYDLSGRVLHSRFFATVISSAARLTYGQVAALLYPQAVDRAEPDAPADLGMPQAGAEQGAAPQTKVAQAGTLQADIAQAEAGRGAEDLAPEVISMLFTAGRLSDILSVKRHNAGALDFDLPEAEYEVNAAGELVTIKTRQRNKAHLLIENFMIAANEAVATFLAGRGIAFLFRIHPEPDPERIDEFFNALARTGLTANPESNLSGVLQSFKGTEQEFLVGRMALRSMPKALYHPSNVGHFGLALRYYCHFTSPIRRYADLTVHRALKHALGLAGGSLLSPKRLVEVSEHINSCELAATEAERETLRRMAVLALYERIGEKFSGTIAGMNDFGIFILLDAMPVEGMVRVERLDDDYYEYDSEVQELRGVGTGRRFYLGLKVETSLLDVNRSRLEINLELVSGGVFGKRAVRGAFKGSGKKTARPGAGKSSGRPGGAKGSGPGRGRGAERSEKNTAGRGSSGRGKKRK